MDDHVRELYEPGMYEKGSHGWYAESTLEPNRMGVGLEGVGLRYASIGVSHVRDLRDPVTASDACYCMSHEDCVSCHVEFWRWSCRLDSSGLYMEVMVVGA